MSTSSFTGLISTSSAMGMSNGRGPIQMYRFFGIWGWTREEGGKGLGNRMRWSGMDLGVSRAGEQDSMYLRTWIVDN